MIYNYYILFTFYIYLYYYNYILYFLVIKIFDIKFFNNKYIYFKLRIIIYNIIYLCYPKFKYI